MTVPKAIADRFVIQPGDEIERRAEGNAIRVLTARGEGTSLDHEARLRAFDEATALQQARSRSGRRTPLADRGWTRADLYDRVRSR